MDFTFIIEASLRLLLTVEYALIALVGLAAAINCVATDFRLRRLANEQQQILDGIREAGEKKAQEKEKRRQARLAALGEMIGA